MRRNEHLKTREENRRDHKQAWYCVVFFGCIAIACVLPDILTAVGL